MASTSYRRPAHASLLAGLVALAAGSACVQEQDYLIVERAVWFDDPEQCVLDTNGSTPLTMVADVAFADRIGMGFVVTNNQVANANSNTGIDDTQIEVESVEVNLSFSGGAVSGGSFEATVPNNTIAGGESLPFLVQIPTEVVDSIRAGMAPGQYEILEMDVTFKGRKYGASYGGKLGEVSTRVFTYPIEICHGCLSCGGCGFAQPAGECQPGAGDTGETGDSGETGETGETGGTGP